MIYPGDELEDSVLAGAALRLELGKRRMFVHAVCLRDSGDSTMMLLGMAVSAGDSYSSEKGLLVDRCLMSTLM